MGDVVLEKCEIEEDPARCAYCGVEIAVYEVCEECARKHHGQKQMEDYHRIQEEIAEYGFDHPWEARDE